MKVGRKLLTILSVRIIPYTLVLGLSACANGPEKRVGEGQGPFSARALNEFADKDPDSLVRIGEGFERSGDYGSAYRLYRQAQAADPANMAAATAYNRLLVRLGRMEEGLAGLKSVVDKDPLNDGAILDLAHAYLDNKQALKAADTIEAIAVRDTAPTNLLVLAARMNGVAGRRAQSSQYFDRALKKSPNDIDAQRFFALSFALDGAYDVAVSLLQTILDRPETSSVGQRTLALVYALSGQTSAASHIIESQSDYDTSNNMSRFYNLLSGLSPTDKAMAAYFDRIPVDALVAKDESRPE